MRREVALRLLEWGEGLASESGQGGDGSMPSPRGGRALLGRKRRATSQCVEPLGGLLPAGETFCQGSQEVGGGQQVTK